MEPLQKEDFKRNAAYLLSFGIRPSQKRSILLEYLQKYKTHPTVDEMYKELLPLLPTLSKTTIYNTMSLFESHGLVATLNIEEKNLRFDATMEPHAHFLCRECGKVRDVQFSGTASRTVIDSMTNDELEVEATEIYYKGVCAECRKK